MEHGSRGPFDLFTNVTQLELETKQCGDAAADTAAAATAHQRNTMASTAARQWHRAAAGGAEEKIIGCKKWVAITLRAP
jgi:hypothetical protein